MSASRSERLLRIAAWALPVLVLASCSRDEAPELPPVIRPVKTLVVGGEVEGEFNFPGTVQGAERSVLSFRVPGQLIELPVDEGAYQFDIFVTAHLPASYHRRSFSLSLRASLPRAILDFTVPVGSPVT